MPWNPSSSARGPDDGFVLVGLHNDALLDAGALSLARYTMCGPDLGFTLECRPTGSMKAGGYVEQRQYRIHLADDLFDPDDAALDADGYRAQHRHVRWDTPFEDADREEHSVGPVPMPRIEQ